MKTHHAASTLGFLALLLSSASPAWTQTTPDAEPRPQLPETSITAEKPPLPGALNFEPTSLNPKTTGHYLSEPVGFYNNPGWTKERRFSTTRVYLQRDPWEVGVEQWWRFRTFDDKATQHLFTEELEIGLPWKSQLDIYYDWVHEEGESSFKDVAFEIRKALADWDVIPLNPTFYAEYKLVDPDHGADVVELKLLLGDDLGERLQYGFNVIWEQETGGEQTREWQATWGLSYTISEFISAGAEMKYNHETVAGDRDNPEHKLLFGPSFQIRPWQRAHLDLVGLFGLTDDAPNVEGYIILGLDLGGGEAKSVHAPASGIR